VQTAATACSAAANGHCRSVRISSDQHRRCRRNCVAIEACLPYQRRRPSGPCENQTGGGRRRGQRLTSRRRHPLCSTQLAVPETAPFLLLYPTPGVAGSHPRRIAAESWGPAVAPTVAVLWARPPVRALYNKEGSCADPAPLLLPLRPHESESKSKSSYSTQQLQPAGGAPSSPPAPTPPCSGAPCRPVPRWVGATALAWGTRLDFPKGGARSDGEPLPLSSPFCACYSSRTGRNPCAMYGLRCSSMMMMRNWYGGGLGWPQWHAAVDPPCAAAGLKNHTARTEISLSLCFHHDLLFRPHCGDELRAPLTRPRLVKS
jgi:hypothetical protein